MKNHIYVPDGYKLIWRPSKMLPNGSRIYARQYGLKAFPMVVPIDDVNYTD